MKNQKYIESSTKCTLQFLKELNRQTWGYKAFRAVVDLTLADLAAGKVAERYKYDSVRIAEKINYSNAEYIRKELNKLADGFISRHGEAIKEFAIDYKLSATPVLKYDDTNGGQYNRNEYWIDYEVFQQDEKSKNEGESENISTSTLINEIDLKEVATENSIIESNFDNKISGNEIKYFIEFITIPKIFNWMVNYELSGFRLFFVGAMLMSALTIAAGSFFLTVFYFTYSISFFDFFKKIEHIIIINFAIFLIVKNTWLCITKRIVSIIPPLIASPNGISITDKSMGFNETQLECVATDKIRESTGKPIRKIQLVSYWATCPICKEKLQRNVRIDVSKGGKEFHNRLIGRCSESPTEHIYSFDHITRIGKLLRQ